MDFILFMLYCIIMKALQLDAKKALSINFKRHRIESKMTQVELAKKIGITQASLSQIENGERWPEYPTIVLICEALKIQHTELTSHPDLLLAFKTFNKNKLK